MNEVLTINNIRCYEENGVAYLDMEACARGLGFVDSSKGAEYVRWNTVRQYMSEIGFSQEVAKDSYIPENIFYRLAMKAKNETAERFQALVADEIIPDIRKRGAYLTPKALEALIADPDSFIRVLVELKETRKLNKELEAQVAQRDQMIGELKPKADYTDWILNNPGLVTITQIAKDYGMSGNALNKRLHKLGVQYKQSGQWLLYSQYHHAGYTHSKTIVFKRSDGRDDTTMETKWTQKGRLFLYDLLKAKAGLLPVIEQPQIA